MLLYLFVHLAVVTGFTLAILLSARILRQHRRPTQTIAWFFIVILAPHIGVPLFLMFGGKTAKRRAARKERLYRKGPGAVSPDLDTDEKSPRTFVQSIFELSNMPPVRQRNDSLFISDGQTAYKAVMEMIASAKKSIHITTFTVGCDETGREFIQALAAKAREGVQVRLLLDAVGCMSTSGKFSNPLREAGGNVGIFMPMLPTQRRWSTNLRNHRKILVADNREALIGGMNFGAHYMSAKPIPEQWIDTCMRIRGSLVHDIERVFLSDWVFATGEKLIPPLSGPFERTENSTLEAQVAPSGPDLETDPLSEAILAAIHDTRQRIWVVTPYFVPDEGIFKALRLQSRLGRDVRIVLPARSDIRFGDFARNQYLRDLQSNGARIFLKHGPMVHAKHIIFDDSVAIAGSANLDMRSLYLNYEISLFIYSKPQIGEIAQFTEDLIAHCKEGVEAEVSRAESWIEDLAWIVSPVL